jgi:hypothetical protein
MPDRDSESLNGEKMTASVPMPKRFLVISKKILMFKFCHPVTEGEQ